jgi:uncharacterized protein YjbI with pentapeptide repeats
MKKIFFIVLSIVSIVVKAETEDVAKSDSVKSDTSKLEFNFKWDPSNETGRCVNAQGKEGYNPKHLGECGDLRGMSLSTTDLNGYNLDGSVFDGLKLVGYNFNGASLRGIKASGTDFSRSRLNGANLTGSDLSGADFSKSELYGSYFVKAKLSGAQFKDSKLGGSHFESAQLEGAYFNVSLKTVNLKNAIYSAGTYLKLDTSEYASRGLVRWEDYKEVKKDIKPAPERVPASKQ